MQQDGVQHVTTAVGGGEVRFLLTYTPEMATTSYGQIIINVDDFKKIDALYYKAQEDLEELLPDVIVNTRKFLLGPGDGGKIQLRISGPNHDKVRELSNIAKNIILDDPMSKAVREDWREKVKVIRPQLLESQARRLGIERPDLARKLQASFIGTTTGVYREEEELLNIVARAPKSERMDADNLNDLEIWSPAAGTMIPMRQVVSDFKVENENAIIWRRDRKPTITIHADPREGLASSLLNRVKPKIEQAFGFKEDLPIIYKAAHPIPGMPGYTIGWDGEAEDSAKANAALAESIPMFFGLMVLIVIFLFNAIRQPLIIWLTVPLAMIGVSVGLLSFQQPFGFMALLGLLSLSGMLIKNAIVLIDQIDLDIREGKEKLAAIVDSGVSRMRPVSMAAITTILGMAPLLSDAFFVAMAVTIMVGLGFATVLTLIVVPVLYAIFFKVPFSEQVLAKKQ